jgi:chromosome segregation ATPase
MRKMFDAERLRFNADLSFFKNSYQSQCSRIEELKALAVFARPDEIENFKITIAEKEAVLAAQFSEIDRLTKIVDQLKVENESLVRQEVFREMEVELGKAKASIADFEQEVTLLKAEIASKQSLIDSAISVEGASHARVSQADSVVQEAGAVAMKYKDLNESLNVEISQLKLKLVCLETELEALRSCRESDSIASAMRLQTMASAREARTAAELHIEAAKAQHYQSEVTGLRKQISNLEGETVHLNSEIAKLQLSSDPQTLTELEGLRKENSRLTAEVIDLKGQLEEEEEEEDEESSSESAPAVINDEAAAEIAKLNAQVERLKIEKEQIEKARAQLQANVKILRDSAEKKLNEQLASKERMMQVKVKELEDQAANMPADVGTVLNLLRDYHSVLKECLGKRKNSNQEGAPSKIQREQ